MYSGGNRVILQQMFYNNTIMIWPEKKKEPNLLIAKIVEFLAFSLLSLKIISKFNFQSFDFFFQSLIRVERFFIN